MQPDKMLHRAIRRRWHSWLVSAAALAALIVPCWYLSVSVTTTPADTSPTASTIAQLDDARFFPADAQTSDIQLKQHVKPLGDGWRELKNLSAIRFQWREGDNRERIGLIAQEVEQAYPGLVYMGADGYRSVNYAALVAPLIEGVKALDAQNSALRERLDDQESRLRTLESKISQ